MPSKLAVPRYVQLLLALPPVLALLACALWWTAVVPVALPVTAYWLSVLAMLLSFLWFRLFPLFTIASALITAAFLMPLVTVVFGMTSWLINRVAP
jgi:hypothetical protein